MAWGVLSAVTVGMQTPWGTQEEGLLWKTWGLGNFDTNMKNKEQ